MNANKNYIRSISWGHLAYPAGVILLKFEIFQSVSNGLLGRIKPARCPAPQEGDQTFLISLIRRRLRAQTQIDPTFQEFCHKAENGDRYIFNKHIVCYATTFTLTIAFQRFHTDFFIG